MYHWLLVLKDFFWCFLSLLSFLKKLWVSILNALNYMYPLEHFFKKSIYSHSLLVTLYFCTSLFSTSVNDVTLYWMLDTQCSDEGIWTDHGSLTEDIQYRVKTLIRKYVIIMNYISGGQVSGRVGMRGRWKK